MENNQKKDRELNTTMPCSKELRKALSLLKTEYNFKRYEEFVWDMIDVYTDKKPIAKG